MVLLEAIKFSLPLVAMDVGGVSKVVIDEFNGKLIEKDNYENLLKAMLELRNNVKLKKFGQNSRKLLVDKYGIKSQIEKLNRMYETLFIKNN